MTEKKYPESHLGHHVGPAPTSEELGLYKTEPAPICPDCQIVMSKVSRPNNYFGGYWICLECGYEEDKKG